METVKLLLSQKSQFKLMEKIKNKNKNRTRASLFQSSEDGKQEKHFMWPYGLFLPVIERILYIRYFLIYNLIKMQNGPTSFGDGLQIKWLVLVIYSRGLIVFK